MIIIFKSTIFKVSSKFDMFFNWILSSTYLLNYWYNDIDIMSYYAPKYFMVYGKNQSDRLNYNCIYK